MYCLPQNHDAGRLLATHRFHKDQAGQRPKISRMVTKCRSYLFFYFLNLLCLATLHILDRPFLRDFTENTGVFFFFWTLLLARRFRLGASIKQYLRLFTSQKTCFHQIICLANRPKLSHDLITLRSTLKIVRSGEI